VAFGVFLTGQRHIPASTDESIIALQARHIVTPPDDPAVKHSMHPKPVWHRFPILFMAQPYLFPLEAYLAAPFSKALPVGAFGARFVPFMLGLSTLILSLLILRYLGGWRQIWPGALLLAVPSAYVSMLQYGYGLPSYPSHLFLTASAVLLLLIYSRRQQAWLAALLGVTCAAALAGQLMALPLVLMCGVLLLLAAKGWARIGHALLFGLCAGVGWLPYVAARKLYPGAYDAVSGSWPLPEAAGRIWAPLMNHVLPVACGIQSTVFPDNQRHVEWLPWLTDMWPFLWLALMGLAGVFWLSGWIRQKSQFSRDAALHFIVFVGLGVAAALLFALSRRSHSHTYRYMLGAAWAFPFVIAFIHARASSRWLRRTVGVLAVLLAGLNAATTFSVMQQWAEPSFAAEEASLYDVRAVLAYLEQEELDRVYASYHLAYRLTYLSDETVTAGQYYNERFPGWPLPYVAAVEAAPDVAYVMAPRFAINAAAFEAHLDETDVTYHRQEAGDLVVYHNFAWAPRGRWLQPEGIRASSSHHPQQAGLLIDGQPAVRWRSQSPQDTTMWVALEWNRPVYLEHVLLFYDFYRHDRAVAMAVEVRTQGEWQVLIEDVGSALDALLMEGGHPQYGHEFQRIRLGGVMADGLRLRVLEPSVGRDWSIGEIRLWGADEAPMTQSAL
jgi:hypothetical protein